MSRLRLVILLAGIGCIVAGVTLLAVPLYNVWHRGQADQSALNAWSNGGPASLSKAGPTDTAHPACGSSNSSDYALVSFDEPTQYHYAGVAGNGTWDLLDTRSMVHYQGTPDPGQQGNVIIAFHREPSFQYIDQLDVGGDVVVQDRNCQSFTYKVTGKWTLSPNNVTQLTQTTGHDLTLITCTPWWVDTQRMVWRATLVTSAAA